jgi:hypothetical protein
LGAAAAHSEHWASERFGHVQVELGDGFRELLVELGALILLLDGIRVVARVRHIVPATAEGQCFIDLALDVVRWRRLPNY